MATKGHSAKFSFGNQATFAASTTWTQFAKLVDITPPEIEADDIDVSHMESPNQFKQFDPGFADGGEIEFQIQFEKTQNATVYGLFRVPKGFKLEFSDGSSWMCDGYIKKFGNEVDREGIVTANVTVKVSGEPEYTAAAA